MACAGSSKSEKNIVQTPVGNFSLPISQQPGPLIGFGQDVVDEGDFILFSYMDYLSGCQKKYSEMYLNI